MWGSGLSVWGLLSGLKTLRDGEGCMSRFRPLLSSPFPLERKKESVQRKKERVPPIPISQPSLNPSVSPSLRPRPRLSVSPSYVQC